MTISGELRNQIMELAFTTDVDEGEKVQLCNAAGPSKALLLTCRQANREGSGFYKRAYHRYWTEGSFVASRSGSTAKQSELLDHISQAKGEDLENVKNLTLDYSDTVSDLGTWSYHIRYNVAAGMFDGVKMLPTQHDPRNTQHMPEVFRLLLAMSGDKVICSAVPRFGPRSVLTGGLVRPTVKRQLLWVLVEYDKPSTVRLYTGPRQQYEEFVPQRPQRLTAEQLMAQRTTTDQLLRAANMPY